MSTANGTPPNGAPAPQTGDPQVPPNGAPAPQTGDPQVPPNGAPATPPATGGDGGDGGTPPNPWDTIGGMQFNTVAHPYDLASFELDTSHIGDDVMTETLNYFHSLGLNPDQARGILERGMTRPQEQLTPQQILDKELSYNTKMNYSNIGNFAKNLGLDPEVMLDPKSVTLVENIMNKLGGFTHTGGQAKVTDVPNSGADVKALTPEQAVAEYKQFIMKADKLAKGDVDKKLDELIELSTDRTVTSQLLAIYRR